MLTPSAMLPIPSRTRQPAPQAARRDASMTSFSPRSLLWRPPGFWWRSADGTTRGSKPPGASRGPEPPLGAALRLCTVVGCLTADARPHRHPLRRRHCGAGVWYGWLSSESLDRSTVGKSIRDAGCRPVGTPHDMQSKVALPRRPLRNVDHVAVAAESLFSSQRLSPARRAVRQTVLTYTGGWLGLAVTSLRLTNRNLGPDA